MFINELIYDFTCGLQKSFIILCKQTANLGVA